MLERCYLYLSRCRGVPVSRLLTIHQFQAREVPVWHQSYRPCCHWAIPWTVVSPVGIVFVSSRKSVEGMFWLTDVLRVAGVSSHNLVGVGFEHPFLGCTEGVLRSDPLADGVLDMIVFVCAHTPDEPSELMAVLSRNPLLFSTHKPVGLVELSGRVISDVEPSKLLAVYHVIHCVQHVNLLDW